MKFNDNTINIKISSTEESVSKTIEELLELNTKIPQRQDEVQRITESQFEKEDYENKDSRGEVEEVTEKQFGDRKESSSDILEIKLENTDATKGGHNPEAWDKDDQEVRGHKNVAPIWHEVYKKEDDRKKLDKGQLDRKKQ